VIFVTYEKALFGINLRKLAIKNFIKYLHPELTDG
jgi:hypothetical protein